MARSSGVTLTANEAGCAEQLARFFPKVAAAHLAVQVSMARGANGQMREATTLEFASAEHAIFLSTLPLEFNDHVQIAPDTSGRAMKAAVVAVQYHQGRKAVAVRFLNCPCVWVTET